MSAVEIFVEGQDGALPLERWSLDAPDSILPGVDLTNRLLGTDRAIADEDRVLVEHQTIAGLSSREAAAIGLPPPTDVIAQIQTSGLVTQPSFAVTLRWLRANGQAVVGAERVGAFLNIGGDWRRIPEPLFSLAQAVEEIQNNAEASDPGARLAALAKLKEILPDAANERLATTSGLLQSMTIAVADAFSLDMDGEQLVPILHHTRSSGSDLLLTQDQQTDFAKRRFGAYSDVRSAYSLGSGSYVVLTPPLRRALGEVRKAQAGPVSRRRALFASPRAFLLAAFGEDETDTAIESIFRETPTYAERVLGLGLWKPRIVPWVKLLGDASWFGEEGSQEDLRKVNRVRADHASGIMVGDRAVPLAPDQIAPLAAAVEGAIAEGRVSVPFDVEGDQVAIPACRETLDALRAIERKARGPEEEVGKKEIESLLVEPNEEAIVVEGDFVRRPTYVLKVPDVLATMLKPHQETGLRWLQNAWTVGRPGVLLADDMGLGKTIQGLAFLAWLREGMATGSIPKRPILIVAPTGLLRNWLAEHDRHLRSPGLGICVEAFGRGLSLLRKEDTDGRPGLDAKRLAAADWILTTYETLRNFDRDFGAVRFATLLFDEAQKIKTPGIRLTDAAKAMNAEFRIAMTGTPVENRLSDMWCITDTIHPALLGDLRNFSARYERNLDAERLKQLKNTLEASYGERPPVLLRRLKKDRLPELPQPEERVTRAPMPNLQRRAYERVIGDARAAKSDRQAGAMLSALHELRKISLHPDRETATGDDVFIAASARLTLTFAALDEIKLKGERALLFLNDLEMQARLVGLIQRRYRMPLRPMVINGTVAGKERQSRVDRFQTGPDEFDVMILSPQAGGVGLTLTRANHVIHLARWWNPAVEDQCTGRALRIGQEKTVYIHIPMATLGEGRSSFDENLHALLERKRTLMNDALMPPEATEGDLDSLLEASLTGD